MKIVPVIDLQNGIVVRGVAGNRQRYRPVTSLLADSKDPSVILQALQDLPGVADYYVADLDSIQTGKTNRCTLAELQRFPGNMLCDAGVRTLADAESLLELDVERIVIGLETLPDLETAAQLLDSCGADRLVFSLDLKDGYPLTSVAGWRDLQPIELCSTFRDVGFQSFIVLDLAAVGSESGITTSNLCSDIRGRYSEVTIIAGGGVRNVDDLKRLDSIGVDAVLIASALHNGMLSAADLQEFEAWTKNG